MVSWISRMICTNLVSSNVPITLSCSSNHQVEWVKKRREREEKEKRTWKKALLRWKRQISARKATHSNELWENKICCPNPYCKIHWNEVFPCFIENCGLFEEVFSVSGWTVFEDFQELIIPYARFHNTRDIDRACGDETNYSTHTNGNSTRRIRFFSR